MAVVNVMATISPGPDVQRIDHQYGGQVHPTSEAQSLAAVAFDLESEDFDSEVLDSEDLDSEDCDSPDFDSLDCFEPSGEAPLPAAAFFLP